MFIVSHDHVNGLCAKGCRFTYIIVSKEEMKMTVYDNDGKELLKFPIACGMNLGQKVKAGDNRTPEGVFKVVSKESAAHWTYDFGKGPVKGAYGAFVYPVEYSGV